MRRDASEDLPLLIEELGHDCEVAAAAIPEGGFSLESPWGTAALWHLGLQDPVVNRGVLDDLALDPAAWGDYTEAAAVLAHLSILTVVAPCPDDEAIKYVKFIEYAGDVGRVLGPIRDFVAVTVVRPWGGRWFVWGMSAGCLPSRREVWAG